MKSAGFFAKPATTAECDWCQDSSRPPLHRNVTPERIEWVCELCLAERGNRPPLEDPEPCGCEEADALRERIAQALAHLEHRESYGRTAGCVRKAVEILKR
jgi:hypothetical protein